MIGVERIISVYYSQRRGNHKSNIINLRAYFQQRNLDRKGYTHIWKYLAANTLNMSYNAAGWNVVINHRSAHYECG